MSSREIINGQEGIDRHREFFTFSPERQRMEYYMNKNYYNTVYTYLYSDDDKVCLGTDQRIVKFANGKAWAQSSKDRKGLTYDKHTKKVKLWYNTKLSGFSVYEIEKFLDHMHVSWFKNIYSSVNAILTPTMLGKVLSKKITDPVEFCREFIKSKLWLKNSGITPEKLWSVLDYLNKRTIPLASYMSHFALAESANVLCDKIITGQDVDHWRLNEILQKSAALDKKLDFSKSIDQLCELNTYLDREIMKLRLETNPDQTLYKDGDNLFLGDHNTDYSDPRSEPLIDLAMQDL